MYTREPRLTDYEAFMDHDLAFPVWAAVHGEWAGHFILNLDGEPCCNLCGGYYGKCSCTKENNDG